MNLFQDRQQGSGSCETLGSQCRRQRGFKGCNCTTQCFETLDNVQVGVTFSEKETKMRSQLPISKFEILSFYFVFVEENQYFKF